MRILLLGDFSSAQYNLKLGLQTLGHDVTLVSHRDGFKKTPTDVKLFTRSASDNKYIGAIREVYSQVKLSRQLKGFDVVQTAAHVFFHNRIDKYLFPRIFENNSKTVMFHAACSEPYNRFVKTLSYSPCNTCKLLDLDNHQCEHEKKGAQMVEYDRYRKYNAIVSSHYEYYKAFEATPFSSKNHFIPIPINASELGKPISVVPQKLNVYYGETRKGFKGGEVIEEAIAKIKASPIAAGFNFIISKKLSYSEYVKVMDETHILIDQANSYSYGVNALVAMSKGKIVLSGAEPEALNFMGIKPSDCPIVNIKPSVDDIFNKLVALYEQKSSILETSLKSMEFVKNHHNPIVIAKRYYDLYRSL